MRPNLIAMAGLVGEGGCVIAVDVQQKMLDVLRDRAERAGVAGRLDQTEKTLGTAVWRLRCCIRVAPLLQGNGTAIGAYGLHTEHVAYEKRTHDSSS